MWGHPVHNFEKGRQKMKVNIIDKQTGESWIGQIKFRETSQAQTAPWIAIQGFYYPHEEACNDGYCYLMGGCGMVWRSSDDEYEKLWFLLKGRDHKVTIKIENVLTTGPIIREIETNEKA